MAGTQSPLAGIQEPFVGDELISIAITVNSVEFHFQKDILQVGGPFMLRCSNHADEYFEPAKRLGAVQVLWPLIGRLVTSANWADMVELAFDDAALIRVLPTSQGLRGTILGKSSPSGMLFIEDF